MVALDEASVRECCGSRRWQDLVCAGLPYASADAVKTASAQAVDALSHGDWLAAFAAHSMIGAVRPGDWTGTREQNGMADADDQLRMTLAAANVDYRERFGFVFLIRARGRSAAEMLDALQSRIDNPPEVEFATACEQQREITALRLEGMMAST